MDALPSRATVLTGVVREVVVLEAGRRLVLGEVRLGDEIVPLARLIRVRMKRGDETAVSAGDRVQLRAVLRRPAPPSYPGGWDQQFDAWFQGVGGGGTAVSPVVIQSRAEERGWGGRLQALREMVAARAMAALPGTDGAVAATLLTGTARAIPETDRAAFRDSGLAHLLAVAGAAYRGGDGAGAPGDAAGPGGLAACGAALADEGDRGGGRPWRPGDFICC